MARKRQPSHARDILDLMVQGSQALGLRLAFHDVLQRSGLASEWVQHHTECCLANKRVRNDICTPFCVEEVHRAIAGTPEGRIHTCPFGYTEIAVPVFVQGSFAGVLFAGQCWLNNGDRPAHDLVIPPDSEWLNSRRTIVQALADRLGLLLAGRVAPTPEDRHRRVLQFLQDTIDRPVSLEDLAAAIHLSPSRAGHVVREAFGVTFPKLVGRTKTREAASLLAGTDLPIGAIAGMVGYADSNYFAYVFRRHLGMSPREYRRRYRLLA